MPIATLFVEGVLEVQLLAPILLGDPVPQQGGSKNSLKARAGTERRENKIAAGYLRDRDFDFDPPEDLTRPTLDSTFQDTGVPFGWRWCRHEIENYLIDPAVVTEATGWSRAEIEDALRQAAAQVRHYEAARWTIGVVRRALPPHYKLETRPDGLNEFDLPPAIDTIAVNAWALDSIADHRKPIETATAPAAVQASLDAYAARFDDAFVAETGKVLVWFAGKDLLAGLAEWLTAKGVPNSGAFRALLRDWIIANPIRAIELLPEWNGMIDILKD